MATVQASQGLFFKVQGFRVQRFLEGFKAFTCSGLCAFEPNKTMIMLPLYYGVENTDFKLLIQELGRESFKGPRAQGFSCWHLPSSLVKECQGILAHAWCLGFHSQVQDSPAGLHGSLISDFQSLNRQSQRSLL